MKSKHKLRIVFCISTLISLYVRYRLLYYKSGDYIQFLEPWFNTIKENGGLNALSIEIGDYNIPYLTILALLSYLPINSLYSIKIVSIVFDYICALAIYMISQVVFKKRKKGISLTLYIVVLFLPTVILNSSYWGQSDSIYTAFVLISIYFLLKKKNIISAIYLGIAFAFKLQTIFILPIYIILMCADNNNDRVPIYFLLIIFIVNIILTFPAIFFGRSIYSCLNIYNNQISEYGEILSLVFPNIYSLLFNINEYNYVICESIVVKLVGIAGTAVLYLIMLLVIKHKKIKFNNQNIIELSFWSILTSTFFLPCMHDRYLFVADILSWIYYIYNCDKPYIPIMIQSISLNSYLILLFNYGVPLKIMSVIFLLAYLIVSRDLYNKYICNRVRGKNI